MCPSSLQVDTIAGVHIESMTSNYTSVQTATGGRLPCGLVEYFNLCAEEYLFFKEGYIHPEAWQSWCRGMVYYLQDDGIRGAWNEEMTSDSYLRSDVARNRAGRREALALSIRRLANLPSRRSGVPPVLILQSRFAVCNPPCFRAFPQSGETYLLRNVAKRRNAGAVDGNVLRRHGSLLRLIMQPEPELKKRGLRIVRLVAFLLPHRLRRGR
jgi:hypothetical protein